MQPKEAKDRSVPGSIGTLRLFGVPLRLHFTFILLLVFLVSIGLGGKQSAAAGALYVIGLFASVVLHELGHAIAARAFKIRTVDIVMYPIGGISRLERTPKAREELPIALAGPIVNFLIAGIIIGILAARGEPVFAGITNPNEENLLLRIAAGNLILALFNLLPAFPMDGGRILRAIVGRWKSEEEATRIAARTGQFFAILMGLYGLLSMQFMLVFIAFFVYLGAMQESAIVTGRGLMEGVPVRSAMVTEFRTLHHGDSIRDAAEALIATSQQDFPVMLGDQVIGLLDRNRLMRALASDGPDAYVAGAMDRDFVRVTPDMPLSDALQKLSPGNSCALVLEGDRLAGLLTAENLSEFLMLRRFGVGQRTLEPHASR